MNRLFAGCAVAALILSGCGGTPHGPPKTSSASAPAPGGSTAPTYGSDAPAPIMAGTPHGPPRVLQLALVPTVFSLSEDIDDAADGTSPRITAAEAACKHKHLKKYRKAEAALRATGNILDDAEISYLEQWLDNIVYKVYADNPATAPTLPNPDPYGYTTGINCPPYS